VRKIAAKLPQKIARESASSTLNASLSHISAIRATAATNAMDKYFWVRYFII
jgi:hypothetical protein